MAKKKLSKRAQKHLSRCCKALNIAALVAIIVSALLFLAILILSMVRPQAASAAPGSFADRASYWQVTAQFNTDGLAGKFTAKNSNDEASTSKAGFLNWVYDTYGRQTAQIMLYCENFWEPNFYVSGGTGVLGFAKPRMSVICEFQSPDGTTYELGGKRTHYFLGRRTGPFPTVVILT